MRGTFGSGSMADLPCDLCDCKGGICRKPDLL